MIARLDVKGSDLVKTIQLEGLRKLGSPEVFAKKYYKDGIDEILYMDTVASLYGRNHLSDLVKRTVRKHKLFAFLWVTQCGMTSRNESPKLSGVRHCGRG